MDYSLTASPALVRVANEAFVGITPEINLMREFATDFSSEFTEPGFVVKVPVAKVEHALSAFDETTNNYETNDGTLTFVPVELSTQIKSTFTFRGKDLLEAPNAPFWGTCGRASGNAIKQWVSKTIGGAMLSTVVTNTYDDLPVLSDLTLEDYANLRSECEGYIGDSVVLLAPAYYNNLLSKLTNNIVGDADPIREGKIANLFGFKSFAQCRDMPTGVLGAIVPSDALVFASRAVKVADEQIYSEYGVVTEPESGLTLTLLRHGVPSIGAAALNVATIFGYKFIQPEACTLLIENQG